MKIISKQRGLALISWFFIITIAVLFITFLIRLIPIYIDGFAIYDSLDSMRSDSKLKTFSAKAVKKSFLTRLNLNSVYGVTGEDVYVSKRSGKTIIEVDYEARENIVGNLDFVVSFKKEVTIQ